MTQTHAPTIAIACGGTGGHLFPGLAVAEQLVKRGCAVMLIVSPKEVDQQAVKSALERRAPAQQVGEQQAEQVLGAPIEVVTLPAVGLQNRNYFSFARSFAKSWLAARKAFAERKPVAALAMGGFTSAPPIFAAKQFGARTFLHESNTIPGKANRWLSRFVDECFVGFPQAASRLHSSKVVTTGTPVRPQFRPRDAAACRAALGLDPDRPTILVMGGSQGASGINDLIISSLPMLAARNPQPQFFHLSGPSEVEKVRRAYAEKNVRAVVHGFFGEMDTALSAATVAVSRSGASSLAEIAAMRVPSVLIPYPAATDNHQYYNALAFAESGAACLPGNVDRIKHVEGTVLAGLIDKIWEPTAREKIQSALAKWHAPQAAEHIAETMLKLIAQGTQHLDAKSHDAGGDCGCGGEHRHEWRVKSAA
jgi:UDP-N-acetylglucosamine--N-acetylmuramyl-(pentapeptide) pyrophosphoryl-undecaprenol N-acetylglucosamine transferase